MRLPRPAASPAPPAEREFHVSRSARERYRFDEGLFALSGNVVIGDLAAARRFAESMNAGRDLVLHPESAVRPGEIAALGLIDEINHLLFRRFREATNPRLLADALAFLAERLGGERLESVLARFCEEFPPLAVHRNETSPAAWIDGETAGESHREIALEELVMLSLANANPAFGPFRELFDDTPLVAETAYPELVAGLHEALDRDEVPAALLAGGNERHILELLRAPALAAPGATVEEQLRLLLVRFEATLGGALHSRLLTALDVLKEEGRAFLLLAGGAAPPGVGQVIWQHPPAHELSAAEIPVPTYAPGVDEPEAFTPDRDWMPRLVLLARNAFVWLDQLSRTHGRRISTLAEVPESELAELARRGITGLWLIGLWQRSAASRRIKQLMGNPEAVASAYSLFDYEIAAELGGDSALDELQARCARYGIRLASDMVPNHVGIDSRWVLEHPEWFVQLPAPPFPVYSFTGPDLSPDPRVAIRIEDRYWTRADAAVVFRRTDRATGEERYLYHGNDGTNMPWNDTAQLDYLKPEVREAVLRVILRVARRFPIIRFDAAMTLAKRHFQRLWYPEPGTGGDIPSRAERGLTKAAFDRAMPEEFWREVVDRSAAEAPDTLLLAEAFWLMESYFVRTLGMHRVYNSAFMVLLRDEENAKYRKILAETLAFDPEILYRFVNFVNNPDERTAVDQFGRGDKYFGVCTLMATLPGLPMFGHGQMEGFAERYGMEYRRAYHDETPDAALLARHEREIFPLLHRRRLFAGVGEFTLYDVQGEAGTLEDVYALSNRAGEERALVLFHNRNAFVRGRLRLSVPAAVRLADGERRLVRRSVSEALGLRGDERDVLIFREQSTGLQHLLPSRELLAGGFAVELGPYQTRALVDLREVRDESGRLRELATQLAGRGVPDVEKALRTLALQPIHRPLARLLDPELLLRLLAPPDPGDPGTPGDPTTPASRAHLATEEPVETAELERERTAGDAEAEWAPFEGVRGAPRVAHLRLPGSSPPHAVATLPSLWYRLEQDDEPAELSREWALFEGATARRESRERAVATARERALERDLDERLREFLTVAAEWSALSRPDLEFALAAALAGVERFRRLRAVATHETTGATLADSPATASAARVDLACWLAERPGRGGAALCWLLLRHLGELAPTGGGSARTAAWFDEWQLAGVVEATVRALGADEAEATQAVAAIRLLLELAALAPRPVPSDPGALLARLVATAAGRTLLGVNRYAGRLWLRKEGAEAGGRWLTLAAALAPGAGERETAAVRADFTQIAAVAEQSGYGLEATLSALAGQEREPTS